MNTVAFATSGVFNSSLLASCKICDRSLNNNLSTETKWNGLKCIKIVGILIKICSIGMNNFCRNDSYKRFWWQRNVTTPVQMCCPFGKYVETKLHWWVPKPYSWISHYLICIHINRYIVWFSMMCIQTSHNFPKDRIRCFTWLARVHSSSSFYTRGAHDDVDDDDNDDDSEDCGGGGANDDDDDDECKKWWVISINFAFWDDEWMNLFACGQLIIPLSPHT